MQMKYFVSDFQMARALSGTAWKSTLLACGGKKFKWIVLPQELIQFSATGFQTVFCPCIRAK